ncbi:MAG: putative ABC transporter permease [Clostridiales bacterium]|nr:putative ABC transporter permease [Clostridiales bacterium]
MSLTPYDICWFFVVYSLAGWIIEVIFHATVKGKVVNRGFLNGPVCPVYGFGMIMVLVIYNLIGIDNAFVIFLEGLVFTTLIELFAGFILDKFFHARWWDYSKMPLNLNGYICAGFSIIWGLAVVFVIKLVHVFIYRITSAFVPERIGWPILMALYVLFIADTVVTVLTVIGLNKKLEELDRISASLKTMSNRMSDRIGNNSLKAVQKAQESAVQAKLGKAEFESELQQRYDTLKASITEHRHFGAGRILRAFPDIQHRDYKTVIEDLKKRINERK